MKITNKILYNEIQDIKKQLNQISLIKYMAGTSLSISLVLIVVISKIGVV